MVWQIILASRLGLDLGDIEFLRQKSLNGDLIISTVERTTTGTTATYTPATGKTFFLYKAYCRGNATNSNSTYDAELQNDGAVRDRWDYIEGYGAVNGVGGADLGHESVIQADKLVGNSAKIYRIEVIAISGVTVNGTIIGWIENT